MRIAEHARAGRGVERKRDFLPPPAPRRLVPRGFTILEMVTVLAIIVLLVAAATPEIAGMLLAEKLKAPARELEAMAVTARCRALAEQRPYQIILQQDGFRLERPGGEKNSGVLSEFRIAKDVIFEMADWPEEKWRRPKLHVWYFPPSGLCEPIRVMFRKDDSYFLQRYSAVTGWDQEEAFFIR